MRTHFLQLLEYDRWANRQLLSTLEELDHFDGREQVLELFTHLLEAQMVWFSRIAVDKSATADTETTSDSPEALADRIENNYQTWYGHLKTVRTDFWEDAATYQNSSGDSFETPHVDILQHLIIHGQHHRAQISQLLRQADITPPKTDYIFYHRSLP